MCRSPPHGRRRPTRSGPSGCGRNCTTCLFFACTAINGRAETMTLLTPRGAIALAGTALATPAIAQTKQAPGVTATELLIGQTMPYSGPASSYAPIGKVEVAYIDMINQQGGINGRKIRLLSLDDGYSPPK